MAAVWVSQPGFFDTRQGRLHATPEVGDAARHVSPMRLVKTAHGCVSTTPRRLRDGYRHRHFFFGDTVHRVWQTDVVLSGGHLPGAVSHGRSMHLEEDASYARVTTRKARHLRASPRCCRLANHEHELATTSPKAEFPGRWHTALAAPYVVDGVALRDRRVEVLIH